MLDDTVAALTTATLVLTRLTWIVTVALPPLAIVPKLQKTFLLPERVP
jgi:hypothetical protein